jgi:hypothetical protein
MLLKKLSNYAELFKEMESRGGWLQYPQSLIDYFQQLGIFQWAELYSKEGQQKWQLSHSCELNNLQELIGEVLGADPSVEDANEFLAELCTLFSEAALDESGESEIPGFEFMTRKVGKVDVGSLSTEEHQVQCNVWISYHLNFYNDLSIATHGESIFSLVARAIDQKDSDAMGMAIQIDRSLLPYFQSQYSIRSMAGDSNFWDSIAYRINNPPIRGRNKHPLLWVLLKDLHSARALHKGVTSKQVLDLYSKGVEGYPRFIIDDVATVQRQRRKFLLLYRQPK